MKKAIYESVLEEAKKASPQSFPNPSVGCIIVNKNEDIIGRGYTQTYPGSHAESVAIDSVESKEDIIGSTLYVSLMPCCHQGNNPPCVNKILESGIKKVVVALDDPNPLVGEKSKKMLKEKGIEVFETFPLDIKKKLYGINETFYMGFIKKERPWITLKYAMTLDGKMADYNGNSKWITGESSRERVQYLRATHEAIMVGENTVLKDNPHLGVRLYKMGKGILRVILNLNTPIPLDKKVFTTPEKTLFVLSKKMPQSYIKNITNAGKDYWVIDKEKQGIEEIVRRLKEEKKIGSILVEGGSKTLSSFTEAKMVDKVYVFIAPSLLLDGKYALSPFDGESRRNIEDKLELKEVQTEIIDTDILMMGYLKEVGDRANF